MSKKKKSPNTSELEEMIYGKYGLYERVKAKIKLMSNVEAAKIIGVTPQAVSYFLHPTPRPKMDNIIHYAKMLGME